MDMIHFTQLLDVYGGHPDNWKQDERHAALDLLKTSLEAQRLQKEALALDNLLDQVTCMPPSSALKARILEQVAAMPKPKIDIWEEFVQWILGSTSLEHIWRPAIAFGLPLLLGIWLGLHLAANDVVSTESTLLQQEEIALLGFSDTMME
jgi:hypothetical protein